MVKFEKSCGGVVYRLLNDKIEYLLIFNKKGGANGHWGFPKGHMEENEDEITTALREIKEETGLDVSILDRFKTKTRYSPQVNIVKDVVYFIAEAESDNVKIQESEVSDFVWQDFNSAQRTITNKSDKTILKKANDFLNKTIINNAH